MHGISRWNSRLSFNFLLVISLALSACSSSVAASDTQESTAAPLSPTPVDGAASSGAGRIADAASLATASDAGRASSFVNPVVAEDCPDPGVLRDGEQYVMACTSTSPEYPLRTSDDLVHWKLRGTIFTQATKPLWAARSFWAPEIHRVGDQYLAYFSARHIDGDLAIGVASSRSALGPYRDSGAPLLREAQGAIDAHQFAAPDGTLYLLWKPDGNATGQATSIKVQPLTPDGLALAGSATTLLTNTESWEGSVVEGPWLIFESGYYYLFYSGNSYHSPDYAVGVARATAVTGPYTKAPAPILSSTTRWNGPGHGSVVRAPNGEWVFVFHAWLAGQVGAAVPGRQVLVTRIGWADGWPKMLDVR
jgi:arabinan endo-1,5-alpha-L-arabinosidase